MFGLTFLLRIGLSLATVLMPVAIGASAQRILKDRISGAIIGSALGDALARCTSLLDTKDEIQSVYGSNGLTTMRSFTPQDWVRDQTALYTHNSVLSRMMLNILIDARKKQATKEGIADHIARDLIALFGLENKKIDPLFDYRYHTMENRHAGEQLALFLEQKTDEPWWSGGFKINTIAYNTRVSQESDSSAIMRAWPVGLVFSENITNVKLFTDYQVLITHHHPTVRAASVALAVGIAYALQGASVEMVVNQMVKSAAQYDRAEQLYKPDAHKRHTRRKYNAEAISKNEMLTSDMIRYAADMAQMGYQPERILGTTNKRQENNRSHRGFLLGYEADEAVAAAVYIFVRHADHFKNALIESANAFGRTSLIASLTGALVGARCGVAQLRDQGFGYELARLEHKAELEKTSEDLFTVLKDVIVAQAPDTGKKSRICTLVKLGIGVGLVALGGWLTYKYVVPYFTGQPNP